MPKKIPIEEIKLRVRQMYPKQTFDFSTYKNGSSKIKATDPEYGVWYPSVKNLLSKKRKCRKRHIAELPKRKVTIQQAKERIMKAHGDQIKLDEATYINTWGKCRFFDCDFGEFWASPHHVFGGSGHKKRGFLKATRPLSIEEVEKRLVQKHGDTIKIDKSTYRGLYHKTQFTHIQYGTWWATPANVITNGSSHPAGSKKRTIATFIKNYGATNPLKNEKIFKKMNRSRWDTISVLHWKTKEELICRASYEYAVVRALNERKIEFDWQIKIELSNGMTYFVDLYLKSENKYVEIKGYFFTDKNRLKWNTFHKDTPNSELWYIKEVLAFVKKTGYMIGKEFKEARNEKTKRCMG